MTVADKVGQLFLVSFQGRDVGPDSDIAVLVRDYRVGGVVLQPANDNFRNVPVSVSRVTGTTDALGGDPEHAGTDRAACEYAAGARARAAPAA